MKKENVIELNFKNKKADTVTDVLVLKDTEQAVLNYMLGSFENYLYVKNKIKLINFTFHNHNLIYRTLYNIETMIIEKSNKKFDINFVSYLIDMLSSVLSKAKNINKESTLNILSKVPSSNIDEDLNLLLHYSLKKENILLNQKENDSVIYFEFEDLNSITKAVFIEDRLMEVKTTNIDYVPIELKDTAINTIKLLTQIDLDDSDTQLSISPEIENSKNLFRFFIQKDCTKLKKRKEEKQNAIKRLYEWASKYDFDEESFPLDFNTLKQMDTLVLRNKGIEEIPEEICLLENLVILDIGFNKIKHLPKQIEKMNSLHFLHLEANELKEIPEVIINKKNLIFLSLKSNKIKTLPSSIFNLKMLNNLCLCCNEIKTIPKGISKLFHLHFFCINGNKLNTLPEEIVELKKLKSLAFSNNYIKSLPKNIEKLKKLEELEFENNNIESINPNIFKLTNIKYLSFDDNVFKYFLDNISSLKVNTINITHSKLLDHKSDLIKRLSLNLEKTTWIDSEDLRENGCIKLLK